MKLLKFKKLIISFTLILITVGSYSYYDIPKQELPDLTVPYSLIQVTAPGYSSEDIDEDVVLPTRNQIMSLPNIDIVESYVFDNYALILVGFEIGVTNAKELQEEVADVFTTLQVNENVNIEIKDDFNITDIMYVFPVSEIEKAYQFEEELLKIDGVEKVEISKFAEDYYKITLDNNLLLNYGLSIEMVSNLVKSDGVDFTLGYAGNNAVVTANNYNEISEVENIVVGQGPTGILYLKDISTIELVTDKNYSNTVNGTEAMYLSIFFENGIDITRMGEPVRDVARDYENFKEVSFFPDDVEESIDGITSTLVIGMAVVLVVVLIGLGFRSAITILITFPFTTFSTVLVLHLLGYELQNMSIAGLIISIGIIVDNAIVVIDAIKYNLERKETMEVSISNAIKHNSIPVLTSTLTTIVAFTPLMFLPGVAGQMAFTLPLTVIVALIFSYIVAIFVVPIIASKMLVVKHKDVKMRGHRIVKAIIKRPVIVTIVSVICLFSSIAALVLTQPIKLFPTAEKEYIIVDYTNTMSSDLNDMKTLSDELTSEIESEIVLSAINYRVPPFYTTLPGNLQSPNSGRIVYKHKGNNAEEIERISAIYKDKYGDDVTFTATELVLNNVGAPIEIKLYDLEKSDEIVKAIRNIDGVEEVEVGKISDSITHEIVFNEQVMLQNGIYKGQVEEAIAILLNGSKVDVIDIENVDNNLYINSAVSSIEDLLNQNVVINQQSFPLSQLVSIVDVEKPISINRYNYNISQSISVYISDDYSVYTVNDKVEEVLEDSGANYAVVGEVQLTQTIFIDVMYAGLIAASVIFLILLAQFNRFRNILTIMSTILLSFIGSAVTLMLFRQEITFSVALGLVSLMGIVVNNGILLLDYINKSERVSAIDKCMDAVERRSRAIVISNVTTISGLIPLIVMGNDFFSPMAITMAGGLLLAVPLSLVVLPSLYILTHRK